MPGLIAFTSNEQMEAEENDLLETKVEIGALVGQVHSAWQRNRDAKRDIDIELMRCLRQVKGEYDPEELQLIREHGGGNTIFMMLTATKVNAAIAWLQDVMLPTDTLPVGVEPTPVPELPPQVDMELMRRVVEQFQAEMQQIQQSGQQITQGQVQERIKQVRQEVLRRVQDKAKDRADKMTRKLLDVLEEGAFRDAMEDFLSDFATYPTAILKGPIRRMKPKIEWGPGWQPVVSQELTTTFERISPFDIYPAPYARTPEDGDFIERMRVTREQVYDMRNRPGYNVEAIDQVLSTHSLGGLRDWLWTDSERDRLNNQDATLAESSLIDALCYWGYIDGHALMEWGIGLDLDPNKPYHVEALVIGNDCVRCRLVDDAMDSRPYHIASMFSKPDAFWGEALPKRMRNTQKMCNSIARSLADNLAVSSGPQAVVNVDALADGEDVTNIYPWKVWQVSYSQEATGTTQPIQFYQPSANSAELMNIYRQFELKADDETGVPRYTYGNEHVGGAGNTASGLSMLFEAASKAIRKAVGAIDSGVMRPLVRRLWMDEMIHGTDPDIKGDARIVARGAAALLIKDQAQQKRLQFLQLTANPVDMQIVGMEGRATVLREIAKELDMPTDRVVPTDDVVEQRVAAQRQQPNPDVLKAQAELQMAQAKLQLEQAKAQSKAQIDQGELQRKAQKDQQDFQVAQERFKLDTARYLSGEEQKLFARRMGLLGHAQA